MRPDRNAVLGRVKREAMVFVNLKVPADEFKFTVPIGNYENVNQLVWPGALHLVINLNVLQVRNDLIIRGHLQI
jgi:hypothetical protein